MTPCLPRREIPYVDSLSSRHDGILPTMKPSLQFRLSQHLTLTPQLQQSIRLLQLSTVELNQEIDRMLMDNPALEREDAECELDAAAPAPAPTGRAVASRSTEPPAPDTACSSDIASTWRGPDDDD